jgi:hypothetical protein
LIAVMSLAPDACRPAIMAVSSRRGANQPHRRVRGSSPAGPPCRYADCATPVRHHLGLRHLPRPAATTTRTPSCPAATPPAPRKKPWTAPAASTSATPPPGSPSRPRRIDQRARPLEVSRVRGIRRQ